MLTATEAANALGVSRRHLYTLAASKMIGCYRFGSAVRFDPQCYNTILTNGLKSYGCH